MTNPSFDSFVLDLLAIIVLILVNGFFVAAEFALVRSRRTRIQALVAQGNVAAQMVRDAVDRLDRYISATQIGVTLASLALGWLGEPFLAQVILRGLSLVMPVAAATVTAHGIALVVAFAFITFMQIVVGELVPKNLALNFPEKTAMWIIRPMRWFTFLFRPTIRVLNASSAYLLKFFGAKLARGPGLALTEEEFLMLLTESRKAGVVSEDEQRMLQRVFKFHDKTVREIMVPRPDMTALELHASEKGIKSAFEQGYSRLPVYDGNLSNIKGIVYVKDLIYTLQDPTLIKLVDLVREALFVPEGQAVSTLLREFQRRRVHMAIVVDEFGDTAGLVTLEDVVEEIVGEIQDEYDYEPADVEHAPDGSYMFNGKTNLDRFREVFPGVELPEGAYETVAGLTFQVAGHVPREGDVIHYRDLIFRIIKREGRRLRKIAVYRPQPVPPPPAPGESGLSRESIPALHAAPPSLEDYYYSAADGPPPAELDTPAVEAPLPRDGQRREGKTKDS